MNRLRENKKSKTLKNAFLQMVRINLKILENRPFSTLENLPAIPHARLAQALVKGLSCNKFLFDFKGYGLINPVIELIMSSKHASGQGITAWG
jgi:hypothetical protein